MPPQADHAEKLSRAISEIDLTSIRHPIDTLPEYGPTYSKDELLSLRPEMQGAHTGMAEGNTTSPGPPVPPAPTPEHPANASEDTQLEVKDANVVLPPAEPAKKKSSEKNKKAAPTGFEGLCSFSKSDDES
jgi:hypothetical protein